MKMKMVPKIGSYIIINDPLFMGYIDEEDWKDPGDFHSDTNE